MVRMPLLEGVLRWRYLLIVATGVLMVVGGSFKVTPDTDWQFFSWGSDLLFGSYERPFVRQTYRIEPPLPGGLELYANYAFLQSGPPALLVAKVLAWTPDRGLWAAPWTIHPLGLAFLYC